MREKRKAEEKKKTKTADDRTVITPTQNIETHTENTIKVNNNYKKYN